ncbi:MAG: plastocyanin/azurin family copper-binding protein, partial [Candidatus Diapherotrites archaeon]|nr:plastocyanin/azurin family copper-binding protein [Candidatus Diapherotrites archaeon]
LLVFGCTQQTGAKTDDLGNVAGSQIESDTQPVDSTDSGNDDVVVADKTETDTSNATEKSDDVVADTGDSATGEELTTGEPTTAGEETTVDTGSADNTASEATVKEFALTAKNFKFYLGEQESPELKVKKGDTVRIVFTVESGTHDWVLNEFNAATKQYTGSGTETIEFVVDKTGTFEYYCSVGSHRAMGMKGNLVVE